MFGTDKVILMRSLQEPRHRKRTVQPAPPQENDHRLPLAAALVIMAVEENVRDSTK